MAGSPLKLDRWLIHGFVLTLPIVVTLIVLAVVLDFLLGAISPVVAVVEYLWSDEPSTAVVQLTTVLSLLGIFLLVGIVAELTPGEHVTRVVDETMSTIPGVSTVYTSVRRARNILVADDADQFQDVKLIEFPHEGAYMLGFLVGDTPAAIEDNVDYSEMLTLMVPLGPNPTTNGFVMHMPAENVHDVDMNVEETIQSIVTLGAAEVDGGETGELQ